RQPESVAVDAAEYYLKESVLQLAAEYDRSWDEQAAKDWKVRHDHFQGSQKRIEELKTRIGAEDLSRDELLELAQRQAEKDGYASTLPIMERAVERFPNDPVILYNVGGVRLSLGDEAGLNDLNRAGELDKTLKLAASDLAFNYLRSKGRLDEARQ